MRIYNAHKDVASRTSKPRRTNGSKRKQSVAGAIPALRGGDGGTVPFQTYAFCEHNMGRSPSIMFFGLQRRAHQNDSHLSKCPRGVDRLLTPLPLNVKDRMVGSTSHEVITLVYSLRHQFSSPRRCVSIPRCSPLACLVWQKLATNKP